MANDILVELGATTAFTITLAGLAAGAARQATLIDNSVSKQPSARIGVKLTSGAVAPTANRVYSVYLLRTDGAGIRDDNAGTLDAAIAIENAPLLGTIVVTNTIDKSFFRVFDTVGIGALGDSWGVAIKNDTDQALNATAANHSVTYQYYHPEIQ